MAEVWVATNLSEDGKRYRLIRAEDVRHMQLVGERPRLLVQVPGGEVSGWVTLVDSPEPYSRFAGVGLDGAAARPPVPDHFHLELAAALDAARLRARDEGQPLVVRPVIERDGWVWRTEGYAVLLGERSALAELAAPHAAAS
ncbi:MULTISPECIES: hypothetical protein [Streptomyces]|uniref:hypothetical protein n=1 Tax=Streptomyces scabiei TaxID=1930 RepID=UPI001B33B362|nr:hypothetical protein [Streptomyces sp. LBUM 1487]MBP5888778.1 hypothetical protein [Streptomyces sp. LBUM 1487]